MGRPVNSHTLRPGRQSLWASGLQGFPLSTNAGLEGRPAKPSANQPGTHIAAACARSSRRHEEAPRSSQHLREASVEQLADALVQAAQEVHVGRASVQPLVLHQQLPEHHLRLLSLLHDHQLGNSTRQLLHSFWAQFLGSHATKTTVSL